jgi:hypothetical protein
MEQIRIALTISGAVSLGAYEGGALAALVAAAQALSRDGEPPLRIDAIGGASAGLHHRDAHRAVPARGPRPRPRHGGVVG